MSINRVVITGNLTRDPELSATAGGMSILKMGIAVNDRRKNQQTGEWEDQANYIDVVVFGQRGESLSRFLSKGSKIAVDGRLRYREWENQQGDKRSKIEVVADDVDFMSGRGEGGGAHQSGGSSVPAADAAPVEDLKDGEEIPF